MSDALRKSIVDAIEEGQLKLGYREETIRLYYPLSSLCTLMHQSMDAAEMTRALATFSEQVKGELGEIEVSRKGERFCLAVGARAHRSERVSGGFHRGNRPPRLHHGRAAGDFPQARQACTCGGAAQRRI